MVGRGSDYRPVVRPIVDGRLAGPIVLAGRVGEARGVIVQQQRQPGLVPPPPSSLYAPPPTPHPLLPALVHRSALMTQDGANNAK